MSNYTKYCRKCSRKLEDHVTKCNCGCADFLDCETNKPINYKPRVRPEHITDTSKKVDWQKQCGFDIADKTEKLYRPQQPDTEIKDKLFEAFIYQIKDSFIGEFEKSSLILDSDTLSDAISETYDKIIGTLKAQIKAQQDYFGDASVVAKENASLKEELERLKGKPPDYPALQDLAKQIYGVANSGDLDHSGACGLIEARIFNFIRAVERSKMTKYESENQRYREALVDSNIVFERIKAILYQEKHDSGYLPIKEANHQGRKNHLALSPTEQENEDGS